MEKQSNHEYGQTDPDYIDQNTLIDGNPIQSENHLPQENKKEHQPEFGESDPDYIEQNTLVDNDNYARDEDPYEYQKEYIEELKYPENKSENTNRTDNEEKNSDKETEIKNTDNNQDKN